MFAHNTQQTNYYALAEHAARRVEKFLRLPTTLITDNETLNTVDQQYSFDNTIIIDRDKDNFLKKNVAWHNTSRYKVYELSPYEETLIIDTDYIINSDTLLKTFEYNSDFVCHSDCRYLLKKVEPEYLHVSNHVTLWATVMRYRRSNRTEAIFNMIKMIQDNYDHYARVYNFMPYTYRNDYALTIALATVNGHITRNQDFLHWKLLHIAPPVQVTRYDETSYKLSADETYGNRTIRHWYNVNNVDFHMLDKKNCLEIQ